jgi:hypothetical protein
MLQKYGRYDQKPGRPFGGSKGMTQVPRRGRPPKFAPGERTRGPLTIRLRDEAREELVAAAAAAGRSLSEEIEYRLELSFGRRDYLRETWGNDFFKLAEAAAKSLAHLEKFSGESWVKDERTGELLVKLLAELVHRYRYQADLAELWGTPVAGVQKSDTELVDTFATLGGLTGPERSPPAPRTFAEAKAHRPKREANTHLPGRGTAKSDTEDTK